MLDIILLFLIILLVILSIAYFVLIITASKNKSEYEKIRDDIEQMECIRRAKERESMYRIYRRCYKYKEAVEGTAYLGKCNSDNKKCKQCPYYTKKKKEK